MKYLREINENDLEILRCWKNSHSEMFFYKDEISKEQQEKWYEKYQKLDNDYMFIVEVDSFPIGCMGIRYSGGTLGVWDIYNVILGDKSFKGRGIMSDALKEMLYFINTIGIAPITVKVLKCNDAIHWYEKNEFSIARDYPDYYYMVFRGLL